MNWLNFSEYENSESKFTAELSKRGGFVTFSNSGKGGNKKYFTLSLDSFIVCLKDILLNHSAFIGHENYIEKEWRDLGSKFYSDLAANAQCTVQTKPMFATLSKIILWANSPKYDTIDPEQTIILAKEDIQTAITKLESLSEEFSPDMSYSVSSNIDKQVIFSNKSIREFAKFIFTHFFGSNWPHFISETSQNKAAINELEFISHDFDVFQRIIGEFTSLQTKSSLTSSGTIRYFEDPVFIDGDKCYYFTNQWNGDGDYSLTFNNLKSYFEKRFTDFLLIKEDGLYSLIRIGSDLHEIVKSHLFINALKESGLIYPDTTVTRFVSSLLTKPFVILTGLSGSGKTKLAQAFAEWICEDSTQYRLVPVGADWTNREPLLGFPNALENEKYVKPDNRVLDLIIEAGKNVDKPYFLILDEMNLSHVERYFADFLSTMESKGEIFLHEGTEDWNGVPPSVRLPKNLFIIGTVNIDETTYMFSPKVLDRANTIEFRITEEEMGEFLKNPGEVDLKKLNGKGKGFGGSFVNLATGVVEKNEEVLKINSVLSNFFVQLKIAGAEFGYRTASEIQRFARVVQVMSPDTNIEDIIDFAILQKLLPKLHGSRRKLEPVFEELIKLCLKDGAETKEFKTGKAQVDTSDKTIVKYPLSLEKIVRMYNNLIHNGFTSFAEA